MAFIDTSMLIGRSLLRVRTPVQHSRNGCVLEKQVVAIKTSRRRMDEFKRNLRKHFLILPGTGANG